MKFLNLITIASVALAAPSLMPRQDGSVVSTVNGAVKTLQGSAQSNVDSLTSGIDSLKGSVDTGAAKQAQDTITSALKGITAELKKATDSITSITTGAAGGVASAVKGFGQKEVDQLASTIKTAQGVVSSLQGALEKASTDLTPEVKKAVAGEIDAAKKAIGPFVTPLTAFGDAASKTVGVKDLDTSALTSALGSLTNTVQGLVNSIGLPGVGKIPGINVM